MGNVLPALQGLEGSKGRIESDGLEVQDIYGHDWAEFGIESRPQGAKDRLTEGHGFDADIPIGSNLRAMLIDDCIARTHGIKGGSVGQPSVDLQCRIPMGEGLLEPPDDLRRSLISRREMAEDGPWIFGTIEANIQGQIDGVGNPPGPWNLCQEVGSCNENQIGGGQIMESFSGPSLGPMEMNGQDLGWPSSFENRVNPIQRMESAMDMDHVIAGHQGPPNQGREGTAPGPWGREVDIGGEAIGLGAHGQDLGLMTKGALGFGQPPSRVSGISDVQDFQGSLGWPPIGRAFAAIS